MTDLRIDTEWGEALLEIDDSYTMVPANIASGYFTQVAPDNADYAQENDFQHVTNAVWYQHDRFGNKVHVRKKSASSRK